MKYILGLLMLCLCLACSAPSTAPKNVAPSPVMSKSEWSKALRTALSDCKRAKLRSLSPRHDRSDPKEGPRYHGFLELGQTELSQEEAKRLSLALLEGVDAKKGESPAFCFNPRHGLSLEDFDLLICFQCQVLEVYQGEYKLGSWVTTGLPSVAFNETVEAHGLELPED